LELWVEGPTDASRDKAGRLAGVLPSIVLRTLGELTAVDPAAFASVVPEENVEVRSFKRETRESIGFGGGRNKSLDRFCKKVLQAFRRSESRERNLVIAVFDTDHGPDAELRVSRRDALCAHLIATGSLGRMPAVCVQEVEAWLLADFNAVSLCVRELHEKGWPQRPEEVRNPKEWLKERMGDSYDAAMLSEIAASIDLDLLTERCPEGYGRFRQHALALVVPRVAPMTSTSFREST
jgi:hypothetical protein